MIIGNSCILSLAHTCKILILVFLCWGGYVDKETGRQTVFKFLLIVVCVCVCVCVSERVGDTGSGRLSLSHLGDETFKEKKSEN